MESKKRGVSIVKVLVIIVGGFIFFTIILSSFSTVREEAEKETIKQEVVMETEEKTEDITQEGADLLPAEEDVEFCSSSIDYNSHGTLEGGIVYCDGGGGLWTTTLSLKYPWSSSERSASNCIEQGSTFEACHACDTLIYAGYSDWHLPNPYHLRNDFGVSACGWSYYTESLEQSLDDMSFIEQVHILEKLAGPKQSSCSPAWDPKSSASGYWSSFESISSSSWAAWGVIFGNGEMAMGSKNSSEYVRCRRGN